jgi:hypothetical protein
MRTGLHVLLVFTHKKRSGIVDAMSVHNRGSVCPGKAFSATQIQINKRNDMKRLLAIFAATAAIVALPHQTYAQQGGGGGRGNFDPEQMRQRMMDRYKEVLEVKTDDEWKVIEPRIQKVTEARREASSMGGMRGMFGGGGRRGGGGGGDNQGDQAQNRRNFGPQPSAAATDLQKAIDSKASADTIKAKLAAYREDHKAKQASLEKAQEDLKKILNVRQEAAAVLAGLLD